MTGLRSAASGAAVLCFAGLACCQAGEAAASSFTINPTMIELSAKTPNALLTLRNDSSETLRFQITAFSWDQKPTGEMDLKPTEDLVIFPLLFTIAPKQERRIRVGAAVAFGATEKNYRMFIDELPPLETAERPAGVRVLTRMGVPVFLQPAALKGSAALENLGRTKTGFTFTLHNTGNAHFLPERVVVRGVDATGKTRFESELKCWYVLAGGTRVFTFDIGQPLCADVRTVTAEVKIGEATVREQLQTPASACGT